MSASRVLSFTLELLVALQVVATPWYAAQVPSSQFLPVSLQSMLLLGVLVVLLAMILFGHNGNLRARLIVLSTFGFLVSPVLVSLYHSNTSLLEHQYYIVYVVFVLTFLVSRFIQQPLRLDFLVAGYVVLAFLVALHLQCECLVNANIYQKSTGYALAFGTVLGLCGLLRCTTMVCGALSAMFVGISVVLVISIVARGALLVQGISLAVFFLAVVKKWSLQKACARYAIIVAVVFCSSLYYNLGSPVRQLLDRSIPVSFSASPGTVSDSNSPGTVSDSNGSISYRKILIETRTGELSTGRFQVWGRIVSARLQMGSPGDVAFGRSSALTERYWTDSTMSEPHNEIIRFGADLGTFGLLVLAIPLAAWRLLARGQKMTGSESQKAVVGSLLLATAVPVLLDNFFSYGVLAVPAGYLLGWAIRQNPRQVEV